MEHEFYIEFAMDMPQEETTELREHLTRCIDKTLEIEQVSIACEINVLITDDENIQKINHECRGIDSPTDVLSFPMFDFTAGHLPKDLALLTDPDSGLLPLGDMCISLERASTQAEAYGHGLERELGYLAVHSVLHLLGYDHTDEGIMKAQMREREEYIMSAIGIPR